MRKFFLLSFLSLFFTFSLASLYIETETRTHIANRFETAWNDLMFPFRLARLSAQSPDETILMPVDGVRVSQVADTWGAPRSGGRRHQGQDIFAERGTAIFSATDGFITRIADSGLGGKHVFITGAGGRRYYYAHLDDWAELRYGDEVTTKTIIGYVGNTGNAITTPPHLHFGIYTNSGAIDPLPLLEDRK